MKGLERLGGIGIPPAGPRPATGPAPGRVASRVERAAMAYVRAIRGMEPWVPDQTEMMRRADTKYRALLELRDAVDEAFPQSPRG